MASEIFLNTPCANDLVSLFCASPDDGINLHKTQGINKLNYTLKLQSIYRSLEIQCREKGLYPSASVDMLLDITESKDELCLTSAPESLENKFLLNIYRIRS